VNETVKSLLILVVAIALGALGQFFLKKGMEHGPRLSGLSPELIQMVFTPTVLLGFGMFGLSSLLYLVVLSREDVSYVYPMVALNYVFVTILAWRFLGEIVPPQRLLGLAIILTGVVVFAFTKVPEEDPSQGGRGMRQVEATTNPTPGAVPPTPEEQTP